MILNIIHIVLLLTVLLGCGYISVETDINAIAWAGGLSLFPISHYFTKYFPGN